MTVNLTKSPHATSPLAVGDIVRFKGQDNDPKFFPTAEPGLPQHKIGDQVRISQVVIDKNATGSGVGYKVEGDRTLFDSTWVEHPALVPAPRIIADLGSSKHDTARAYALKARSRLLTEEQNKVLTDAGESRTVDVIEFRKAVTAALSLAATRAGQSMARRTWTKEARHLLYWADAIIDQHVKGLPIYEAGARSQKIADLEAEVALLKSEGTEQVRRTLTEARRTVEIQTEEIERLHALVAEKVGHLSERNDAVAAVEKVAAEAVEAAETLGSVLTYVSLEILDEVGNARLMGYWDGLEDA